MEYSTTMATTKDVESVRTIKDFALLCKEMGYKAPWDQLQFENGASVTNLLEFFQDNPGILEPMCEWVLEHCELEEEEEEECEDDGENDE